MSENCELSVTENTTGPIVDLDCGEGANPDVGKDICALTDKNLNGFGEDTDKPTSYTLSLGDALTDEIDSTQGDKLEVSAVMGADSDGDGSYLIRVSGDDDPTKTDKLFFEGDVAAGESFTASEAAFGTSFGSETFVHILSSDGSTVLQTINFHTSCSAPLVIGDQYGSISLEGASLVGKDTDTVYEVGGTSAPGDEGVTYEIKDGPGSDLFEVNADGEVSFIDAPDFENPQGLPDADGNPTNNYEVVVVATLEDGTKTEKPLEFCVEDDCIKVTENTTGPIVDLDCGEGANPDVGKDICALTDKNLNGFGEDTDKPTSYTLSLGEALTDEIDSTQGDKLEVSAVMGADSDGDGSYLIRVSGDGDWTKTDKLFFEGDVAAGESFTASEAAFGTSFGSETFVHILSSDGSTVLQTINFHTSCSAPLVIGDQYGSISLEGASLVGKDTDTVYEVGGTSAPGDEGVTYEIKDGPGSDLFEVNADGEVSFIDAPDFENPQGLPDADGNPTNNYEVVVVATLEDGTKTEKPLEFCVEDDCIKVTENTTGPIVDLDCGEGANPDVGKDICALTDKNLNGFGEDTDKPTSYTLSLGEALTDEIDSTQGDKLEVSAVMGADSDGDGSYLIRVSGDGDWTKTDKLFFEGDVAAGESFTASEAAFGTSFGSETFVHILSSDGSTVLQTINFHTSCSAPLVIGDQYGSISLEGASLVGKDTDTVYEVGGTSAPGDEGVTYEIKDGPGSDLFEVNADGEVSFIDAPDFENPQGLPDADGNPTNNYEVVVVATLEDGTKTEKPLEFCVEDDCIKVTENTTGPVLDLDCGAVENPDIGFAVCEIDKPTEYTFRLDTEIDSQLSAFQPDGKSSVVTSASAEDGDGIVFVRMSDSDVATDVSGETYFQGEVSLGDSFTTVGDGTFSSNSYIHIFDDDGTTLLQTIQYHTSCSAPIVIGDQIGTAILDAAVVQGDTYGVVVPDADEGILYEITGGENADLFTVDAETGEVSFVEAPDFEKPQGVNGTNTYQVEVTAFRVDDTGSKVLDASGEFVVCEVKPLDICVEDDGCINITEGASDEVDLDLVVDDPSNTGLELCAARDEAEAVGADLTKFAQLSFTLTDEITDGVDFFYDTGPNQGDKAKVTTNSTSVPDGEVFVLVSKEGDVKKAIEKWLDPDKGVNGKETFFAGSQSFGEEIVANAESEFPSSTHVYLFDSAPVAKEDPALQEMELHTSCSEPLVIGDRVGSVEVSGAAFRDKDSLDLVSFEAGAGRVDEASGNLVYSIVDGPGSEFFTVDPETGEVTFNAPDYVEGGDNSYEVIFRASVEGEPDVFTDKTLCYDVNDSASLGDFVFEDLDADGIQDTGEAGIDGVVVNLLDGAGNVVDTTTTGDDPNTGGVQEGFYAFTGLAPGDYSVEFETPAGFDGVSPANQGVNDAVDSDGLLDAGTGNYVTGPVTLASGDDDPTLDQGFYNTAGLGDYVWEDTNGDGIQNDGETGVNGVTVKLLDENGDPVLDGAGNPITTTTGTGPDGNPGYYSFTGLVPGTYSVMFVAPDGSAFTTPNAGDDTLDSDADPTNGMTQTVVLESGEFDGTLDAGLVTPASLGDFVFEDLDADGIQDTGEAGIDGVVVNLLDGAGNVVDTTTTGDDPNTGGVQEGFYAFTGLAPGDYSVEFETPAGFDGVSPANQGVNDAVDSDGLLDAGTGNYVTGPVTLASGDDDPTLDQGFYNTAGLGDYVWEDTNGDGIQNDGETGVNGVTVKLLDENGDPVLDGAGNPITTTTGTGPDGNPGYYSFTGLVPGTYSVMFVAPDGSAFTTPNAGDDTLDSDADPTNGMTQTVVLESGEFDGTLDAGLVTPASLGDFVFEDLDADGIQDTGEAGIDGVVVNLLDGAGNVVDTTTTGDDPNTGGVQEGFYAFTGLAPGDYSVEFETPAGFDGVSPANQGVNDAVDSDGLLDAGTGNYVTGPVTLASGDDDPTLDQGFYNTAGLGDYVWEDTNGDGIQNDGETGVNGVTVKLLDENGDPVLDGAGNPITTTTGTGPDGNPGYYSFTGLVPGTYSVMFVAPDGSAFTTPNAGDDTLDSDADPTNGMTQTVVLESGEFDGTLDAGLVTPASLGDFVFEDLDADGIQDTGEAGIDGVVVNLLDGAGNVVDTTTTGDDPNTGGVQEGFYAFTGLAPGDYSVEFETPAGFDGVSPANQGVNDAVDSDGLLDAGTGNYVTGPVTLASGDDDPTLDQGFYNTAGLGDYVWEDTNGDGIQNDGETGVNGVTVKLLDENGDPVLDGAGNPITTTTGTGPDGNPGYYSFTGLVPGTYSVMFVAPDGSAFTTPNAGDDTLDSDADPTNGMTQTVVLESGEFDGTLDAGLVTPASLGDFVFEDLDADGIQDTGEAGIDGVVVNLLDGAGNVVDTTTTGDDPNTGGVQEGFYAFTGLAPGDYSVEFETPAGFDGVSPANQGVNDAVDSDGLLDAGTGNYVTGPVTLASGDDDPTLDQGFYNTAGLGDYVWEDTNGDGIQNDGETGVNGVTVKLLDENGDPVLDGAGNPITTTTGTGPDGNPGYYSFTGLVPGTYSVMFVAPDGSAFTTPNAGDDTLDSDADPTNGMTQTVVLESGEFDGTLDAGLVDEAGTVTGRYFCDKTGDGFDEGGDNGVSGKLVELFSAGLDGTFNTSDDVLEASALTDDTGGYLFSGVVPGEYAVKFEASNNPALPKGSLAVGNDSDADPSTGYTDAFVLTSGDDLSDVDAGIECFDPAEGGDAGLLGVNNTLDFVNFIDFNNDGTTTYNSGTGLFSVAGTAFGLVDPSGDLSFPIDDGDPLTVDPDVRVFLEVELDASGNVVAGGAADFFVFEDNNNDGIFDGSDNVLLQGTVIDLGALDGGTTDQFDALIETTGGDLASYFDPFIGISWSSEDPVPGDGIDQTYGGSFAEDFSGEAKGFIAEIDCIC